MERYSEFSSETLLLLFHQPSLSPLMVATMVGPPPSVKALIDAGADLDIKSASGRCVLDLAMIRNDFQIWRCLKDWYNKRHNHQREALSSNP